MRRILWSGMILTGGATHVTTYALHLALAASCRPSPAKEETGVSDAHDTDEPRRCEDVPWTTVAAGVTASCGIHTNGCVECWGNDFEHVTTDLESGDANPPDVRLSTIDMSPYYDEDDYQFETGHACGLTPAGEVVCWGNNVHGEATPPAGEFSKVTTGGYHSCALDLTGRIVCWGHQGDVPQFDPESRYLDVDSGGSFVGTVDGGGTACWIGVHVGDEVECLTGGSTDVRSGTGSVCVIDEGGSATCTNYLEEYGTPAEPLHDICVGYSTACGLTMSGAIVCWGNDVMLYGAPNGIFHNLACNIAHGCAVDTDGNMVCWGSSNSGKTSPPGTWVASP